MKNFTKKGMVAILLSTVMVIGLSAQNANGRGFGPGQGRGQGMGMGMGINTNDCRIQYLIPDLTEDQIIQLEALRFDHQKEMINYRNQMGELRAQRRTIVSAYPIDTKAADKLTDEKTALMNKMMKAQTAHQASVKKILTEEQALRLDQLRQRRGYGRGKGQMARCGQGRPGYGNRPGGGQGQYRN